MKDNPRQLVAGLAGYFDVQSRHRDDGAKTGEDTDRWGWNPLRDHTAKTTARPEFSLIALICAGYEKTIQKDSWRSAEKRHVHYLNQLTIWGYTASPVEQIIIDKHTTDTE